MSCLFNVGHGINVECFQPLAKSQLLLRFMFDEFCCGGGSRHKRKLILGLALSIVGQQFPQLKESIV